MWKDYGFSQFCVERVFEEITADIHQSKPNYFFSFLRRLVFECQYHLFVIS